ncbi:MAG: tetratricopeptide repeat protein [bacterium]
MGIFGKISPLVLLSENTQKEIEYILAGNKIKLLEELIRKYQLNKKMMFWDGTSVFNDSASVEDFSIYLSDLGHNFFTKGWGELEEAIFFLLCSIELKTENNRSVIDLATIHYYFGDHQQAVSFAEQALEVIPKINLNNKDNLSKLMKLIINKKLDKTKFVFPHYTGEIKF